MKIDLPELSLVVLVGPSGTGKSSFARKHFKPTEVLSSDYCRGLVSDDENNQAATEDAFDVLHYIAGKRLKNGLLTVIDATNVRPEDRRKYVQLAREHHCLPVTIVLNLPERVCQDRNVSRPDRDFGPHVIRDRILERIPAEPLWIPGTRAWERAIQIVTQIMANEANAVTLTIGGRPSQGTTTGR